ncbi:VOC family protein [Streptomyces sp. NPDC056169]|uniref:VOC family protein n=1 Tax=Streptomyces sp. NPDC056169 TaxID=3345734 RepID=UPI0035D9F25E
MKPIHWKLVLDAADPHAQAVFWAAALGYAEEDHDALIRRLLDLGAAPPATTVTVHEGTDHERLGWRDLAAVRHPDDPHDPATGVGLGRRVLIQRVPEPKTTKNRLHLDLHPDPGTREAEVTRLEALGATVLRRVEEPSGSWTVMADPEGNEFCVH